MNLSQAITQIKLKLGLAAFSSPFIDINSTILEIIQNITLPTFSTYAPIKETVRISTKDMEEIEKHDEYRVYLLPENMAERMVYLFSVNYDDTSLSGLGYYGTVMPLASGYDVNQIALANATAHVADAIIPKMTFKWEQPRKLYLYNAHISIKLKLEVGFKHDKSLITITDDLRDSFLKLAVLDVKENLYPTLSQYTDLNTAIGNINMKIIESWANAEAERAELIEKWDDSYHLDLYDIEWY